MKNIDVTALGELLIDFTENSISENGNPLLEANPGGAPCNVLAMLAKLGKKAAFIGKVGNDSFGNMLSETIKNCGICADGLVFDDTVRTTLAFVHKKPDGDRDFSFYREPGADMMLCPSEVNSDIIKNSKIFHFGTLSMTHKNNCEATVFAVKTAKESGALISFDPNLREPLWKSLDDAKTVMEYGFSVCDILKISDNEIEFMTGSTDYDKAVRELMEKYHIKLAFATLGKNGSRAYYGDIKAECGVFKVDTIETTGAGDTFCGSALNYILEHDINCLTENDLEELLTFANASAAIITTRRGALKVMPEEKEILELIGR
ncbi:MAG: PfkB family carbohydrate kinase [Oscillospiraceae bacterium]